MSDGTKEQKSSRIQYLNNYTFRFSASCSPRKSPFLKAHFQKTPKNASRTKASQTICPQNQIPPRKWTMNLKMPKSPCQNCPRQMFLAKYHMTIALRQMLLTNAPRTNVHQKMLLYLEAFGGGFLFKEGFFGEHFLGGNWNYNLLDSKFLYHCDCFDKKY